MPDQSGLTDPKTLLPTRDPRVATNQTLIFDRSGKPFKKPKIVAKECMTANQGWTKDPKVAQARREAGGQGSLTLDTSSVPKEVRIPVHLASPDRELEGNPAGTSAPAAAAESVEPAEKPVAESAQAVRRPVKKRAATAKTRRPAAEAVAEEPVNPPEAEEPGPVAPPAQ